MRRYRVKLRDRGVKYKWNSDGYVQRLRVKAIEIIGGPVCCECGCQEYRILEINHLMGGGNREFAKIPRATFYRSIIAGKRNPKEFNILCRVCNANHYVRDILGFKGFVVSWNKDAGVAQRPELRTCNANVAGSNPVSG